MKKNLWRIAKPLILLLAVVGLLLPALPARAESIQFDGTTVSFWLPPGYNKLYQTMEHEDTWGEKTVTWKDYDYHGTRVVQTVTFPDDSRDGRTGDEIDGVGFGGGVLFIRGDTDIRIEAEKYQKPYVEGVIYKEGAITVPGDGVSYPGYYYLSSRTEKEEPPWEWVYTKHNVALRIALTQTEPLYTLWLHFWTWGPADFTDSEGVRYTFKLDGKPVKDTHREYLNRILSSVTISGWKAPSPAPTTAPAPTPAAPTSEEALKVGLGQTVTIDLGTIWLPPPELKGMCFSFQLPAGYTLSGDAETGFRAEGPLVAHEYRVDDRWGKPPASVPDSFTLSIDSLRGPLSESLVPLDLPREGIYEQDYTEINGHKAYYTLFRQVKEGHEQHDVAVRISVGEHLVCVRLIGGYWLDTEDARYSVDRVQAAEKSKQNLQQVLSSLSIGRCGALPGPSPTPLGTDEQIRSRLEQTYKIPIKDGEAKWTGRELAKVEEVGKLLGADFLQKCQIKELRRDPIYVDEKGKLNPGVFGAASQERGCIFIFNEANVAYDVASSDEQFMVTVIHELTHLFQMQDPVTGKRYTKATLKRNPLIKDWMKLSRWQEVTLKGLLDAKVSKNWWYDELHSNFATEYAKTDPYEDMAETAMFYVLRPKWLLKHCPLKYKFFRERIFKGKTFD